MIRGRTIRAAVLAAALTLVIALPGAVAEAATGVSVSVIGKKGKPQTSFPLLSKVTATGSVAGYQPGDAVDVTVSADGRELLKKKITPKSDGGFEFPLVVNACCRYVIEATVGGDASGIKGTATFTTDVPKKLGSGDVTNLFNESLRAQGFHTGPAGSKVTLGTHLAIKAFRKVNHMSWSEAYRPSIFRTLLQGKGAFEPRFDDGKHVEVDISRQVMALIEGDRAVHTFHVSTGTGGTPTVQGNFHFYLKQPGYNAKQMYYSVYFIAGYATHGYSDVPNHNASHGCVRNPIPFSRFIYNWIDIGDPMHVYS